MTSSSARLIGFTTPPSIRPNDAAHALADAIKVRPREWAEVELSGDLRRSIYSAHGIFARGEWRLTQRLRRFWLMYAGPIGADGLNVAERAYDCKVCPAKAGSPCVSGKRALLVNTHQARWELADREPSLRISCNDSCGCRQ